MMREGSYGFDMSVQFTKIALIGKSHAERLPETLTQLYDYLLSRGIEVMVEDAAVPFIKGGRLDGYPIDTLASNCDLAIVVGGDGTLLAAAKSLSSYDVPLIGVNLGRLGFLVDISPVHMIEHVENILSGNFVEEKRFMLEATLSRGGETIYRQLAINEVVIHRLNASSMIEIETAIDGRFLNSQRSDGLIVSTPTGSTAYALSAGGPILSPHIKAMVLAPINPHTLTNRPIVVGAESVIEVGFRPSRDFSAQVVCDSLPSPDLSLNDLISIRASEKSFRLLHPAGYDFFEILRMKLNWSTGNPAESC